MPTFLFVIRRSPKPDLIPLEQLDMAMTTAAFDQSVSLLFLDEGVWQLQSGQSVSPQSSERRLAQQWEALDIYGISTLWVERESLLERGLTPARLVLPVALIEREAVTRLILTHDWVVND